MLQIAKPLQKFQACLCSQNGRHYLCPCHINLKVLLMLAFFSQVSWLNSKNGWVQFLISWWQEQNSKITAFADITEQDPNKKRKLPCPYPQPTGRGAAPLRLKHKHKILEQSIFEDIGACGTTHSYFIPAIYIDVWKGQSLAHSMPTPPGCRTQVSTKNMHLFIHCPI